REGPQRGADRRGVLSFEQDLESEAALDPGDGRRRGSENLRGFRSAERLARRGGALAGPVLVLSLDQDAGGTAERRVAEDPAVPDLIAVEARVVAAGGVAEGVVSREEGLQDHPPRAVSPPGAPRDLSEELEGALGGAKVGNVEAGVRADDPHQAD